ncbi:MAG: hypothetical protein LBG66_02360, partial [Gallionellaceae bacterium]|nr:hypothetical protein [Gallionellaceae bacterium]
EPLYLGGIAVVLLALIGVVYMRRKKAQASYVPPEDGSDLDGSETSTDAEDEDEDYFMQPVKTPASSSVATASVAPLSQSCAPQNSWNNAQVAQPEPPAPPPSTQSGYDSSLDFLLDFHIKDSTRENPPAATTSEGQAMPDVNLTMDNAPAQSDESHDARWHDVATKLDLAKAYMEMGDSAGARDILEEVMKEGDTKQKASAQGMMSLLP